MHLHSPVTKGKLDIRSYFFPFLVIKIKSRTNNQLNICHDIKRTPATNKKPFFLPTKPTTLITNNKIVLDYNPRQDGMPRILRERTRAP
jgi:hypothetical protein